MIAPKIVYREAVEMFQPTGTRTSVSIVLFDDGHAILSSDGNGIGTNTHLGKEDLKQLGAAINRVMDYVESH